MEYLNHFMLTLKCDHPLLCEFPILFSTVKLKLGHTFSQLIHRFNIWILKCWLGAVYFSKFFPIHKRGGKLGFLKSLDCIGLFQKKSKQRWLRIWDFQGYQRNNMWNFLELIKNEVEFRRVTKKK